MQTFTKITVKQRYQGSATIADHRTPETAIMEFRTDLSPLKLKAKGSYFPYVWLLGMQFRGSSNAVNVVIFAWIKFYY